MAAELVSLVNDFFGRLRQKPEGYSLLKEHDQVIIFELTDAQPLILEIRDGQMDIRTGLKDDAPLTSKEITRLRTGAATLVSIFKGECRYSDVLIPTKLELEPIYMVENWMFKRDIINWLGRLIRFAQTHPRI